MVEVTQMFLQCTVSAFLFLTLRTELNWVCWQFKKFLIVSDSVMVGFHWVIFFHRVNFVEDQVESAAIVSNSTRLVPRSHPLSSKSNTYITSTRDVFGLNRDARGRVAPEGGVI